ncbi:MAG: LamG domain-containing protein, partial [Planctomycetota bacterium]|nr:LamG domain-containing protein [Planctomycetota bacterium]
MQKTAVFICLWWLAALIASAGEADKPPQPAAPKREEKAAAAPAPKPQNGFFYLPPAWAERVIFYHSFEAELGKPEINLAQASIRGDQTEPTQGFVGRGYRMANQYKSPNKGNASLMVSSPAFSLHKPITAMLWWRLDEKMKEETCFNLLALLGPGYISSFVRGKGEWCALAEPTYISQVYDFPGIRNHNNPWGGRAWFEAGEWHHVAISVSAAAEIAIYWDGVRREIISVKGRPFQEGEGINIMPGANWLYHPMTIDEFMVIDRALSAEEIAAYVTAARASGARFSSGFFPFIRHRPSAKRRPLNPPYPYSIRSASRSGSR